MLAHRPVEKRPAIPLSGGPRRCFSAGGLALLVFLCLCRSSSAENRASGQSHASSEISSGAVWIESRPQGAQLFGADGRDFGKRTPALISGLPPGTIELRALLDGYTPATLKVVVLAGQRVKGYVELVRPEQPQSPEAAVPSHPATGANPSEASATKPEPPPASGPRDDREPASATGAVWVESDPPGATIFDASGRDYGKQTPALLSGLPPGPIELELVLDGYAVARVHGDVRGAQRSQVRATLTRPGPAKVHGSPSPAAHSPATHEPKATRGGQVTVHVWIDGKSVKARTVRFKMDGRTVRPSADGQLEVSPGAHSLTVAKFDVTDRFTVEPGGRYDARFELHRAEEVEEAGRDHASTSGSEEGSKGPEAPRLSESNAASESPSDEQMPSGRHKGTESSAPAGASVECVAASSLYDGVFARATSIRENLSAYQPVGGKSSELKRELYRRYTEAVHTFNDLNGRIRTAKQALTSGNCAEAQRGLTELNLPLASLENELGSLKAGAR